MYAVIPLPLSLTLLSLSLETYKNIIREIYLVFRDLATARPMTPPPTTKKSVQMGLYDFDIIFNY